MPDGERASSGSPLRLVGADLRVHVSFHDAVLTIPPARLVAVDGQLVEHRPVGDGDEADVELGVALWRWLRFVSGADDFYVVSEAGLTFNGELEDLELVGGLAMLPWIRDRLRSDAGPYALPLSELLESLESGTEP